MPPPRIQQIARDEARKRAVQDRNSGANNTASAVEAHHHTGGADGPRLLHSDLDDLAADGHPQYAITISGDRLETVISGAADSHLLRFNGSAWASISTEDAVTEGAALVDTGVTHMDNFRHWVDHMWSAGPVSGGAITDNGDGTVTVAAGETMLRESTGIMSAIHAQSFAETTLTPTDGSVNWVTVSYVDGGPAVLGVTTNSSSVNCRNVCHLYRITREGTDLHIVDSRQQNTDSNRQARVKSHRTQTFEPETGTGTISASGLALLATGGAWWYAFHEQDQPAFDTSVSGTANENTFRKYWWSGAVWNKTLDVKELSNEYNNSGTLTALGVNKFAVAWVYMIVATECHLAVVIGETQHNSQVNAELEFAPSSLPAALSGTGVLIGQCVVKAGATTPVSVSSAFTTQFQLSAAGDHALLSNRDDSAGHTWAAISSGSLRVDLFADPESATPDTPGEGETGTDYQFFYNPTSDRFEARGYHNYIDFAIQVAAPAYKAGRLWYDDGKKALSYYPDEFSASSMQIGKETWLRVRNTSGGTISDGEVVKIVGATGQTPTISKAIATTDSSADVIGVATTTMADNAYGLVTVFGEIHDLNTNAWAEGAVLYLSAGTAGQLTATMPQAPNHSVSVATVLYQHASNGKILVHPTEAVINDDHITVDAAGYNAYLQGVDPTLHAVLERIDDSVVSWSGNTRAKIICNDPVNLNVLQYNGTSEAFEPTNATEVVHDIVGALIADSTSINAIYDDPGNLITLEVLAVDSGLITGVATDRLLGRVTAGTGAAEELTPDQATAMLDAFTDALQGLVPASGGGTDNFLRADGTWAEPAGGTGTVREPVAASGEIVFAEDGDVVMVEV